MKVLLISKKRVDPYGISIGLINSAAFIAKVLDSQPHITAKSVLVNDNNDIDREVHSYKPDIVIIEAIWVVPEKFPVLIKLYPKIKWFVRIHSEVPFISSEGIAIQWLFQYKNLMHTHMGQFFLSANSVRFIRDMGPILKEHIIYLPNSYPLLHEISHRHRDNKNLDIGCFGAIRPLKNQLAQAIAAIKFADSIHKNLYFHMNSSRIERSSNAILKNIIQLFEFVPHTLILHNWYPHADYLHVVQKMDMGMQVSLSETFNIVAADFVYCKIPAVVSDEISWMPSIYRANPNDIDDITEKLKYAWYTRLVGPILNLNHLRHFNEDALEMWKATIFMYRDVPK